MRVEGKRWVNRVKGIVMNEAALVAKVAFVDGKRAHLIMR
jgi:hypothetical protein